MLFCSSRTKKQRWGRSSASSTVPAFHQNDDAGVLARKHRCCWSAIVQDENMTLCAEISKQELCKRQTSTWYLGGPSMSFSRKESASQYRILSVDVVIKNQAP